MKTIKHLIFVLVFAFAGITALAKDPPVVSALKEQLLWYLNNYNEEKIYVQTDKTLYKPDEYIFFNLFLTDASTGKPSAISDLVYMELYDPKGNLVSKIVENIQEGTAGGEIKIGKEQVGGIYTLRAYTLWMKNFGEDRYFTKTLQVQKVITPRLLLKPDFEKKAYGPGDEVVATLTVTDLKNEKAQEANVKVKVNIEGKLFTEFTVYTDNEGKASLKFKLPEILHTADGLLQAIVSYRGVEEAVSRSIPIVLNKIDLKFYPEGGTWVAGTSSRMAFEALNERGKGADVRGEIIDEQGKLITTFESFHFGMGTFEMNPEIGKRYFARILKPIGTDSLFALPPAESTYSLNLKNQNKTGIWWNVFSPESETAYIIVQLNGIIYDSKTIPLQKGQNTFDFGTQKLPAGIAVFTLCNASGLPLCERLALVNPDKQLQISIKTNKENYTVGEQVKAEINTTDEQGNPLPAHISLAVVDEQLLTLADDKQDNILTYLLLSSDLVGKIYEPSFYFDKKEDKSEKAIDYLLLTHGWRRFTWHDIMKPPFKISQTPENYSRIYGTLTNKKGKPTKGKITLVEKEGKRRVLKIRTNSDGQFAFYNIDPSIYTTLFAARSKEILLTNKLNTPILQEITKNPDIESLLWINKQNKYMLEMGDFHSAKNVDSQKLVLQEEFIPTTSEKASPSMPMPVFSTLIGIGPGLNQPQIMEEVVIEDSRSKLIDLGGAESGSLFSYIDFPIFKVKFFFSDWITEESNINAGNKAYFKLKKGLFNTLGNNPLILVDNTPLSDRGNNISSFGLFSFDNISDITILPAPEAYAMHGSKAFDGVITIMTSYPEIANRRYRDNTRFTAYNIFPKIYSTSRSYYEIVPRSEIKKEFRNDFRTTVYWKSDITTNKNGKAQVEYYNNDATSAFRITAEGLSSSGLIGHTEYTYSSQLPLSLDAKLPNYLGLNDTLQIPVSIQNNTNKTLSPEVEIYAPGFHVTSAPRIKTQIQTETSKKILFTVVSKGIAETHTITIKLKDSSFADVMQHQLNVISTDFPRNFSLSGKEAHRAVEFDLSDWRSGTIEGTANLHGSVFDELFSGTTDLLRQPHGCFEQVSSSTFPNIFVMQLMQATGQGDEKMHQQAMQFIESGYNKLAAYESKGGGFEWYGGSPGHEVLSAYGLIEFYEMSKIKSFNSIDDKLIERTLAFLKNRRNADGTYQQNSGKYGFSGAPKNVNNAYIAYALAEIEKPDEKAYKQALNEALQSKDMYRMALMANAAIKQHKIEDYNLLIAKFILENIKKLKIESSIVQSSSVITETIALWTIALLRAENIDWEAVEKCIQYLASKKTHYGYGSTQATALVLKAFTDYTLKNTTYNLSGKMVLTVNGNEFDFRYTPETRGTLVNKKFVSFLKKGKNTLNIQFSNPEALYPYSIVLHWSAKILTSSQNCPLKLSANLSQTKVKQNETVRLSILLQNKDSKKGQPMSMAVVGIPAGLSPQTWQLQELQEKGVFDFYEILENQLALYYREMGPGETKQILLDLKADIPGVFTGTASSGYLYYTQEERHWINGLNITIEGE